MKLIGFKRFLSKKGSNLCIANVVRDCTTRECERGSVGQTMDEIFVPDHLYDYLQPEHVGKDIDLVYEMSGGRAYLNSVVIGK